MEEIITVNGIEYRIETSAPLTQAQRTEVIKQLSTQTVGCSSCNDKSSISTLATGCGQTKKSNTNISFECKASSGTGKYIYELYANYAGTTKTDKYPSTGYTTNTTHTFTMSFGAGTWDILSSVTDDCASPTVCYDPSTGSCSLIIQNSTLNSITISGCTASIKPTETCTLSAACKDQFGGAFTCPTLTWSSDKTTVATVDSSGVVTGKSAGTANITASSGTITSNTVQVTVTACAAPSCSMTIL